MTTQPEPTPHTPDAATDALPPPWQRLLALSGVAFTALLSVHPALVVGWLTSGGNTPHYTAGDQPLAIDQQTTRLGNEVLNILS